MRNAKLNIGDNIIWNMILLLLILMPSEECLISYLEIKQEGIQVEIKIELCILPNILDFLHDGALESML